MSGFKDVLKEGWHPKGKTGGKESWRGDFKGINQVAGWMGKGKDPYESERTNHVSKPLSSLKDPASFGPPPKHIKRGLGAPLSNEQIDSQNARQQEAEIEEEEPAKPAPPQLPYRADRTGLSRTTNLPPPPPRRINSSTDSASTGSSRPKAPPPPIPPRRQSPSPPPAYTPEPTIADSSDGYLNQQATSNLSRAGVSVPALGIGDNNSGNAPVNELQSRFARMDTNSPSSASPAPPPPARGASYQSNSSSSTPASQSQSTFNHFKERHSDQIEAGKQKISGINEKYGISRRINNFIEDQKSPAHQGPPPPPHPNRSSSNTDMNTMNRKKAPPPPPPKKPEMRSSAANSPSPVPPPLPLDTKPR
ncbi:hypothetical protein PHISCL_06057 [Aspergillus sclerotialis]|uniref:Glyceraldehyde 3-phosphate dehydrogenase n=1 Tax=Aspergillus sclerotialis TaxID=2070753 RepID=A0A3A2ZJM4_9EURO|nr:hypothetical protein PHISCL_06057 [Aspergillus sclerotialis]